MEAILEGSYVGIDVAKRHWDAAIAGRRGVRRFTADAAGLTELMAWLKKLKPQLPRPAHKSPDARASVQTTGYLEFHQRRSTVSSVPIYVPPIDFEFA
jgi:hypothetical protein